jgi:GNAT superfamily N-acetyltransferase
MALDPSARATHTPLVPPEGVTVRLVTPDEPDQVLARIDAVASIAFAAAGTAVGPQGPEAVEAKAKATTPEQLAFRRERLRSGRTVSAVAELHALARHHARHPVSAGSHQPVGDVSEVVGVATLPAFRRRGIAAALVDLLVEDAMKRGVQTVFLSAGDDAAARMYAKLGFRRLGTACIAEPPAPPATAG